MTVLEKKLIKESKWTRTGAKLTAVRKLIGHYTANPGATAENHHTYFNKSLIEANQEAEKKGKPTTSASAHIFVDRKKSLLLIPLDEVAFAANGINKRNKDGSVYRGVKDLLPNANYLSISVELCIEEDGTFHPDTIKRAIDVFAELCKEFKLDPMDDIVRHYDVTGKLCPLPWVENEKDFIAFKKAVNEKVNPPKKEETKKPAGNKDITAVKGTVKVLVDSLWYYDKPDWDAKEGQAKKGDVFTVVGELSVNGSKMYLLKSGLYITASTKYVKFTKKK